MLAVLGPIGDETTSAVLGAYDEALLPLVSVSAGSLLLATPQNRSFLQARPIDAAVAASLTLHMATSTGSKRPGLLQDRTAANYGWESVGLALNTVRFLGHRPYPRVVPAGTEDFAPVVEDMLRAGTDSFVYCGRAEGAGRFAAAVAEAGFTGPRLAPQAVLDPAFLRGAGEAAEGWVLASSFVDASAVPTAKAFTAAYRERFGAAPGYLAAEAYDAVNLVIRELTGAKSRPGRGELVGLLRKATYKGLTKRFAFDPEDCSFAADGVFLYRVEGGRFRFTGTAPAAT